MTRSILVGAVGVTFMAAACSGNNHASPGESTGPSSDSEAGTTSEPPAEGSTTLPLDCIPGAEGCACLDGECVGNLVCVETGCQPGPSFDPDQDGSEVLAGLVVPVRVDVEADEFSWNQAGGPPTTILGEGAEVLVPVPATANPGDVITLRIDATRNTIQTTFDYAITVIEPVFDDLLAPITDTEQLGTSTAISFSGGRLWVTSLEGFVSNFDLNADDGPTFRERFDLAGSPGGAQMGRIFDPGLDDDVDALFVSLTDIQSIQGIRLDNLDAVTIFDTLEGGLPLGPVGALLRDGDDVFTSNRASGQVIRYSGDEGIARVWTEATGASPNALALGPDDNLYVGSLGRVWRVPLLADNEAGAPEPYVEFGDDADPLQEVTGLAFDQAGNLWVGVAGTKTLYLTNYVTGAATTVVREFRDVGLTYSNFVDVRLAGTALYWANLEGRTVARLETGVRPL